MRQKRNHGPLPTIKPADGPRARIRGCGRIPIVGRRAGNCRRSCRRFTTTVGCLCWLPARLWRRCGRHPKRVGLVRPPCRPIPKTGSLQRLTGSSFSRAQHRLKITLIVWIAVYVVGPNSYGTLKPSSLSRPTVGSLSNWRKPCRGSWIARRPEFVPEKPPGNSRGALHPRPAARHPPTTAHGPRQGHPRPTHHDPRQDTHDPRQGHPRHPPTAPTHGPRKSARLEFATHPRPAEIGPPGKFFG